MALIQRNGIWHVRKMVNGVMLAKSTKTANKRQAEQIEAQLVAELVQDVVVSGQTAISLKKIMELYLAERASYPSLDIATRVFSKFKVIKEKNFKEITTKHIDDVINDLRENGHAESSLNLYVKYWNALVNYAIAKKYTPASRASKIKNFKGKIRFLTIDEQTSFLDAILFKGHTYVEGYKATRQNHHDLVVALLDTGARYGEMINIHWHQINFDKNTIIINRQKGGRDTSLTMSTRLRAAMDRRLAEKKADSFVFPIDENGRRNLNWVKQAVRRAKLSEEVGSISLHTCRHTFASQMLQNGMDLASVSHLLGHSNIASTMVYAHFVVKDVADKAADIMNRLNK